MAPFCTQENIAMTPYSALADGWLSRRPGEPSQRLQEGKRDPCLVRWGSKNLSVWLPSCSIPRRSLFPLRNISAHGSICPTSVDCASRLPSAGQK